MPTVAVCRMYHPFAQFPTIEPILGHSTPIPIPPLPHYNNYTRKHGRMQHSEQNRSTFTCPTRCGAQATAVGMLSPIPTVSPVARDRVASAHISTAAGILCNGLHRSGTVPSHNDGTKYGTARGNTGVYHT